MARRFALSSFGILCLSLSALIGFHIGSQSAQAQGPGIMFGFTSTDNNEDFVMLENGDVYANRREGSGFGLYTQPATYRRNFWTGQGSVPTSPDTWGNVKDKYEGEE